MPVTDLFSEPGVRGTIWTCSNCQNPNYLGYSRKARYQANSRSPLGRLLCEQCSNPANNRCVFHFPESSPFSIISDPSEIQLPVNPAVRSTYGHICCSCGTSSNVNSAELQESRSLLQKLFKCRRSGSSLERRKKTLILHLCKVECSHCENPYCARCVLFQKHQHVSHEILPSERAPLRPLDSGGRPATSPARIPESYQSPLVRGQWSGTARARADQRPRAHGRATPPEQADRDLRNALGENTGRRPASSNRTERDLARAREYGAKPRPAPLNIKIRAPSTPEGPKRTSPPDRRPTAIFIPQPNRASTLFNPDVFLAEERALDVAAAEYSNRPTAPSLQRNSCERGPPAATYMPDHNRNSALFDPGIFLEHNQEIDDPRSVAAPMPIYCNIGRGINEGGVSPVRRSMMGSSSDDEFEVSPLSEFAPRSGWGDDRMRDR